MPPDRYSTHVMTYIEGALREARFVTPFLPPRCPNAKWRISTIVSSLIILHSFGPHSAAADVGAYTYGLGHPMKPHRMRVTHELVTAYGMLDKMHILVCSILLNGKAQRFLISIQRPKRASPEAMTAFHTDEYVHFLNTVTPETAEKLTYQGTRCANLTYPTYILH